MAHIWQTGQIMMQVFKKTFICMMRKQNGFLKSPIFLKNLGFLVEMPAFLEKGTQFETEEANETRLVTKIRWVVEATNGLIKKWAYFDKVVSII